MLTQETDSKKYRKSGQDWLFDYAESLGFGEIHIKMDHTTGLKAIIGRP